ncbi:MAG: LytR C-terminal domain-containing protein [Fibrobacteres bacterium]|nr:LytR C-terminal domain-containing protein [Fibrobacterota bacterium]
MKKIPLIAGAAILIGAGILFYLAKIKKSDSQPIAGRVEIPNRGSIQILNGCGTPGAGQVVADILRKSRFDVKEISNAQEWNYRQTIVARRSMDTALASDVAKALGTKNLIPLQNNSGIYDITIFVGADYKDLGRSEE